jgi:hypothetical protein
MKRITWINLILGLWLIASPFALGYSGVAHTAAVEEVVMGIIIAACSWWWLAAEAPMMGMAWFEMLCGIWVLIAPFVLAYGAVAARAKANDVWVGIVVLIVAIVAAIGIGQTAAPPRSIA